MRFGKFSSRILSCAPAYTLGLKSTMQFYMHIRQDVSLYNRKFRARTEYEAQNTSTEWQKSPFKNCSCLAPCICPRACPNSACYVLCAGKRSLLWASRFCPYSAQPCCFVVFRVPQPKCVNVAIDCDREIERIHSLFLINLDQLDELQSKLSSCSLFTILYLYCINLVFNLVFSFTCNVLTSFSRSVL